MTRTTACDGRALPSLIQLDQSRNEMDQSVLLRERSAALLYLQIRKAQCDSVAPVCGSVRQNASEAMQMQTIAIRMGANISPERRNEGEQGRKTTAMAIAGRAKEDNLSSEK